MYFHERKKKKVDIKRRLNVNLPIISRLSGLSLIFITNFFD